MEERAQLVRFFVGVVVAVGVVVLAVVVAPWDAVDWGKLRIGNERTITVTGRSKIQEKNRMARFSAGVTVVNDDKQVAVGEVNEKMEKLIKEIKDFGIEDKDIKTQSLSVFQREKRDEPVRLIGRAISEGPAGVSEVDALDNRDLEWWASNSIQIVLRDVDRAGELADLLNGSGATEVSGPNFTVDDASDLEGDLLVSAVEDAREKALMVANSSGGRLGKVITVSENGGVSGPILRTATIQEMGFGAPVEPGSSQVRKTVTVVFELK